jgi:Spy/CpxP family protein refolding chaperone
MKRNTMKSLLLVPALLVAGFAGAGADAAQAQDDPRFDGPGGLSAPAPPKEERRMDGRGDRRMREHHGRMGAEGKRGGHGRMGMKGHMGRGGRGGMRGGHAAMMEKLNLSDRQKEQMKSLHEAQQRRMIPIRSGLEEAQLDLQKLMRADAPSRSQIDATIDRMAKLRADAQKARVATMLEAHTLLTPEQRKQMKELHGGMGRGLRGFGGGRGMHGGGHHGDEI